MSSETAIRDLAPWADFWCPHCRCGWRGEIHRDDNGSERPSMPCWFCDPQPAPQLIVAKR